MAPTSEVPKIIVSGPPGSGKTSLCRLVSSQLGLVHIAPGDLLRQHIRRGTQEGLQAKEKIKERKLVDNETVIAMIATRLSEEDCLTNGWLLDGFPLTLEQAVKLESQAVVPTKVVLLELTDEAIEKRITGRLIDKVTGAIYHTETIQPPTQAARRRSIQRVDDQAEKIQPRVEAFRSATVQVLDHYADKVVKIDASPDIEEVCASFFQMLQLSKSDQGQEQENDSGEDGDAAPNANDFNESAQDQQDAANSSVTEKGTDAPESSAQNKLSLEDFKAQLLQGELELLKHGRKGRPHLRVLFCDKDFTWLCWTKPGNKISPDADSSITLKEVKQVVKGQQTDTLKRSGSSSKSRLYLSLVASDRTLDLECETEEERDQYADAFSRLCCEDDISQRF